MEKQFTDALTKVVKDRGRNVIADKNFVSYISDYYPEINYDHLDWKNILAASIKEGFGEKLLKCKYKSSARDCYDKYADTICKKYGYNKQLVEDILTEICFAVKSPYQPSSSSSASLSNEQGKSTNQFKRRFHFWWPKSNSTVTPPSSHPYSHAPVSSPTPAPTHRHSPFPFTRNAPYKPLPTRSIVSDKFNRDDVWTILSILISFAAVWGSAFIYDGYYVSQCNRWMFTCVFSIAMIHIFTVHLFYFHFGKHIRIKYRNNRFGLIKLIKYEGAYFALIPYILIIYMVPIVAYFCQIFQSQHYYPFISLLTVILSLCAIIIFAILPINRLNRYNIKMPKTFRRSFLIIFGTELVMSLILLSVGLYPKSLKNVLHPNQNIVSSRSIDYSFMGISLGDTWDNALSKISKDSLWQKNLMESTFAVGDILSEEKTDSIFYLPVKIIPARFNNEKMKVSFYIVNDKVGAISFLSDKQIMNLYKQKYGNPNRILDGWNDIGERFVSYYLLGTGDWKSHRYSYSNKKDSILIIKEGGGLFGKDSFHVFYLSHYYLDFLNTAQQNQKHYINDNI